MWKEALLIAIVGALPTAAAVPAGVSDDGGVWRFDGVATAGSVDRYSDWYGGDVACLQTVTQFVVRLSVDDAHPATRLTLLIEGAGVGPAPLAMTATPGQDAVLAYESGDRCPDFVVFGDRVFGEAGYHVDVALAHALPWDAPSGILDE